jgi:hypothetical protein
MKTHALKTSIDFFDDILERNKQFEYRKNDRDFRVGDYLLLREYNHNSQNYTGRSISARIDYILENQPQIGLPNGYCVMSISLVTPENKE